MSALTPAPPPGVGNILSVLSTLSGSPNGPAIVNFTDSNIESLPPLPGPNQVGTFTFSMVDYITQSASFCAAADIKNEDALCNQPREIRISML